MRYVSTRGGSRPLNFESAMLAGLASDGGLYVPEYWPEFTKDFIARLAGQSYEEIAFRIMRPFVGDSFSEGELRGYISRAYDGFGHAARCPLVQIESSSFLLELFHGPTLAFKDFAMQLVAQLFQAALSRRGERATIIGATSGDTGSAAIEAFRGLDSVSVFILFPEGRISEVQRRQMTTPCDANVHALAVRGDFDDCQARVKDMFNDASFRQEMSLAGINSINWARVAAQMVYYFASATALGSPMRKVSFSVPTGNFGDIYAGYAARASGLPIERLVLATNQNDILDRAIRSGQYRTADVRPSLSPSMDIQVSSNFERALYEASGRNGAAVSGMMARLAGEGGFELGEPVLAWLREQFASGNCREDETVETIAEVFRHSGEVVCPHTAVGVKVAWDHAVARRSAPMVILATAHPAKFPDAVKDATGFAPELPSRFDGLGQAAERMHSVDNDLDEIKDAIRRGLPA
ncbi:MAG: threonine synthase [Albidovulum sp.]|nr:threonine synthase [Albidovulum sp.]